MGAEEKEAGQTVPGGSGRDRRSTRRRMRRRGSGAVQLTEIAEANAAIRGEQYVGGFDVTVQHLCMQQVNVYPRASS